MFLDINTYVGHWPYRNLEYNTLTGLDTLARENDITHMVTANLNGLFYKDPHRANLELARALGSYTGKTTFLPLAVVNPTRPEWERDARAMIDAGFAGFEIAPVYHGYSFQPEMTYDVFSPVHFAAQVLDLAAELDVPVRICASFENFRGRSVLESHENPSCDDIYALLSANKDAFVFVTSFAVPASDEKLVRLLKDRPNTCFDVTAIAAGAARDTVNGYALSHLAPTQLCYGSLLPFQYAEATLVAIEYDKAIDAELARTTAARAFRSLRT